FLGKVTRDGSDPAKFTIDQNGRPYVGLVGEYLRAPSGQALVQIGADGRLVGQPAEDLRFAVYLPVTPGESSRPRLAINADGNLTLRADSTVHGDVLVDGGAVEFGVGTVYPRAKPWSIYHVEIPSDQPGNNSAEDHLRIEMGHSETNPGHNRVAIGHFEQGSWVPCLEIYDDCKINLYGTLTAKNLKVDQITNVQAQALVQTERIVGPQDLQIAVNSIFQAPAYSEGDLSRLEIARLASRGADLDVPIQALLD